MLDIFPCHLKPYHIFAPTKRSENTKPHITDRKVIEFISHIGSEFNNFPKF